MSEEQLITALNNLEEDIERLCVAIEHWEVTHTAREPDAASADSEGYMTAADAMHDNEDDFNLTTALEEHYAAHDVPVELEEVDGKIYVAPQGFVGEDTFMALFGGNDRVKYDSEAPQGKQNWLRREDVRGYIRETG